MEDPILTTSTKFNNIIILITILFTLHRLLRLFRNRHRLPILTLKPNHHHRHQQPLFCTVCLYDVAAGQRYRKLPECNHCFHVDCIDTWFQSKSTCPLCRNQIPDNQLPLRLKRDEPPSFLSTFITFTKNVIKNMGNPLSHDLLDCLYVTI